MRMVYFIICSFPLLLHAQVEHCLSTEVYQRESSSSIQLRSITYLPVVVHILYNTEEQNISDEQILLQLQQLNNDFSLNNENLDNTPEVFKALAGDSNIRFCLANTDPSGNSTNGITRTSIGFEEIGLSEKYYDELQGGQDPWNPEEYINIWVADFGNTGILGFSTFPGEASPPQKDGILVNYKFFGVDGIHQDEEHNKGHVLTHEMGHYFGLSHIWGALNSQCSDDDNCDDTPLQDGPTFGCPTFPAPDICTQGDGIMFMNFMDYSSDDCLSMFTVGQAQKMNDALMELRSGLLEHSSTECMTSTQASKLPDVKVYPSPFQHELILESTAHQAKSVLIYNTQGQVMSQIELIDIQRIETITWPSGIFYLVVEGAVLKIIKLPR